MDSSTYSHRLGKGMIVLAWLVLLGLLTVYFDRYLDRERNPNREISATRSVNAREVSLQRNRAGHYVATAQINGQAVDVMLDTGASTVSIPASVAQRLHLPRGAAFEAVTANGNIIVYATALDRIQLGNIVLTGIPASINPGMQEDLVLLGMSFLKHLEFTQRGEQLILRQYDVQYH